MVTLEVDSPETISASSLLAYQEEEHLRLSGTVRPKKFSGKSPVGSVHAMVFHQGEIFGEGCGRFYPKWQPGPRGGSPLKASYPTSFDLCLPKVPPPGAVIRVVLRVGDTPCQFLTTESQGGGL